MRFPKETMTPNRMSYLKDVRDGADERAGGYGTAAKDCAKIGWTEYVLRLKGGRLIPVSQFYLERPEGGKRWDDVEEFVSMTITEEGRRALAEAERIEAAPKRDWIWLRGKRATRATNRGDFRNA